MVTVIPELRKLEAGGSGVQGQPKLRSKFEAARNCLKKAK